MICPQKKSGSFSNAFRTGSTMAFTSASRAASGSERVEGSQPAPSKEAAMYW